MTPRHDMLLSSRVLEAVQCLVNQLSVPDILSFLLKCSRRLE